MSADCDQPFCVSLKKDGDPCGNRAMEGFARCRTHSHKGVPAIAAARQRRLAVAAIRKALDKQVIEPIDDPVVFLKGLMEEIAAQQKWSAEHVAALENGLVSVDFKGSIVIHPLVELYERNTDRLVKVVQDYIKITGLATASQQEQQATRSQEEFDDFIDGLLKKQVTAVQEAINPRSGVVLDAVVIVEDNALDGTTGET